MHKTLILAARDYRAAVQTKGFLIGLILAPVLMGGSLLAIALLQDQVDLKDKRIAIIDRSGVLAEVIVAAAQTRNQTQINDPETGKQKQPAYLFHAVEPQEQDLPAQRLDLSNQVRQRKLHAFLEIGPSVVHPGKDRDASRIAYYAKNAAMDDVRNWLSGPIRPKLSELRHISAGLSREQTRNLLRRDSIEGLGLVSKNVRTGKIQKAGRTDMVKTMLVPIVMMMLMFMMIMMSVPGMIQSVMEEKTQRIAEVLLGSIGPFELMMGKLISGIGVAMTSSAVYIIGGVAVVRHLGYQSYVPYHILPWFFIYMLLATVMQGAVAAALGSVCSEAKDTQSLTFPAMIPCLIPMFVYFPIIKEPASHFALVMSLIPPFTPMLMLLRQASPDGVPVWQLLAGLAGMISFTLLFVWIGGRIFRIAILMQGTPPRLTNIIRWAVKG